MFHSSQHVDLIYNKDDARGYGLNEVVIWGIISSAALFMLTVHAQDFKDIAGDLAIGRTTLPIAFPRLSRVSMLVLIPTCTLYFCRLWALLTSISILLLLLSIYVGVRYVILTDMRSDKLSYFWYNVSIRV